MWDTFRDGVAHRDVTSRFLAFARLTSPEHPETGTLFVHGGVDLEWLATQSFQLLNIDGINQGVGKLLSKATDQARYVARLRLYDPDGSFTWTRAFEELPDDALCGDMIESILRRFSVRRVMVGHSPQRSQRARVRCGGRIILADTMLSRWLWFDDSVLRGERPEYANPTAFVFSLGKGGKLESIAEYHGDLEHESILSGVRFLYGGWEKDEGEIEPVEVVEVSHWQRIKRRAKRAVICGSHCDPFAFQSSTRPVPRPFVPPPVPASRLMPVMVDA